MRKGFRVAFIGCLVVAASAWAVGAAWTADFTPSTWNPAVGDVVSFSVCDSCLGSGAAYRYLWDFDGDGVVDADTDAAVVEYSYSADEFYEVKLTVRDAGGREETRTKGILVGSYPMYGVRQVITEADGSLLVSVTLTVVSSDARPIGLSESIAAGWQNEVVDSSGGLVYTRDARKLDVTWTDPPTAGDEIVFTYRLYSTYASQVQTLSGVVDWFVKGKYFHQPVCGELAVP